MHIYKLGARHHLEEVAGLMELTGLGTSEGDTFFTMNKEF
jgi:hypothetical protein